MKQIRKRLTYANVMSTIAVFFVVGGASALAATQLGKNTAGTNGRTGWFVVDGVGGTVPFPGGFGSGAIAVSDSGLVAGFITLPGGTLGWGWTMRSSIRRKRRS